MAADDVYAVKKVSFLGKPVTVICQNVNGPCPLLAICNVLLLRGHLAILDRVSPDGLISAHDLLRVVQRRLVDANPLVPGSSELEQLTREKTLQDVISLLPSLLVGLDVNVRFHKCVAPRPSCEEAAARRGRQAATVVLTDVGTLKVVQNKSYNELVAHLVEYRSVLMTEGGNEATEAADSAAAPGSGAAPEASAAHETSSTPAAAASDEAVGAATEGELETKTAPPGPIVSDFTALAIDTEMADASPSVPTTPTSRSPAASSPTQKRSPSKQTVQVMMKERHISDADALSTATVLLEDGPVLEEFFNSSASQLTYYGLLKLHEGVRERQLCVFFRNNHFSTLFKYDGSLYLLVTDAGYLDEPTVVWERLNEIDGDSEYFDASFRPLNVSETNQQSILTRQEQAKKRALEAHDDSAALPDPRAAAAAAAGGDDPDFLFALQLQQEEEARVNRPKRSSPVASPRRNPSPVHRAAAVPGSGTAATAAAEGKGEAESADSREPSSVNDSSSASQCDDESAGFRAGGVASESLPFTEDGRLLISEEELEAQRQAERFYQERKRQQDQQTYQLQQQRQQQQQQQQQVQGRGEERGRRRKSKTDGNDCRLM
ncbi:hypothetical protein PybrP1_005106 [[Pythium] brassicae (nom. inval.)]|nr:hypothetical protein PybrP1_005106 [[Pythium] brassicae (nom. inval.)]